MAENPILAADGIGPDGRPRVMPPVAITAPLPPIKVKTKKAYICSVPNASIHNKDGKRIGFIHGFHETDLMHDQKFLDEEIAMGHPHLREAKPQEIENAHMRLDPQGTMRDKVAAELEPVIRARLEDEIREQISKELGIELPKKELPNPDQNELPLVKPATDENKIAGTGAISDAKSLRERMMAGKTVKTEGATITIQGNGQGSDPRRLTPVSSADIAGAVADSNGAGK